VIGCGGIGGVVAAHLARARHDVTVFTTNVAVRDAIATRGLRLCGRASGTARVQVTAELESAKPFDFVLLATQPPQVEDAARDILPVLAPASRVVCFQNGLCEERVAPIVGADRIVGAVVLWGASMPEPGVAERTSLGGFTLGRLDGSVDAKLTELAHILECIGPVALTQNLRGVRWSKLAINCAMSTLGTIGGERVGVLMQRRDARQLGLEIVSEAVSVARAEGVRLEKLAGTVDLGWLAVSPAELSVRGSISLALKHLVVLGAVTPYRRLRSSMLAAIERGRTPAVDFLNGEVTLRADRHGLAVPTNRAARDAVWAIARGEGKPGLEALELLFHRTRQA
jgi:2-dehydropantoate 2-reductase